MSLRSFERMSPEKVFPMYPVTEQQMNQPAERQGRSITSGGSIMHTVKMQQLDSVEDDERKYLKQPHGEAQSNHDDSMAKMNSGGEAAMMMQAAAVRFSSTRGEHQQEETTPAPTQLVPQQIEEQPTYIYSPKDNHGSSMQANDILNGSNGVFPDLATKDGHKMIPQYTLTQQEVEREM